MWVWGEFILASALIIISGSYLARVGDKIGEVMGWERTWVGLILLSFSTALPELFTSVSSAGILHQPDLSLGNNLGSITFNLFLIAILDFLSKEPLTRGLDPSLALSGSFLILFIFLYLFFLTLPLNRGILGVGGDTIFIFLFYFIALRMIFIHQHRNNEEVEKREREKGIWKFWLYYFILGGLILIGGLWLAKTGEKISQITGLSRTFVGTLFLAVVTSLPELSTTIASLKMGLPNMAVGNILGANLQNLVIPFFSDAFYRGGYLLSEISSSNIFTLILAGILTVILLLGMIYRSRRAFLRMGWDSLLIFLLYIWGMFILFSMGEAVSLIN